MIYHVNSLQKRNYNVDKRLKGNSTHKTLPFPNKMTSCCLTVHFSYFHGWPHINITVTVILIYKPMIQSCINRLKRTNDVLLSTPFSELSKNIRVSVCKKAYFCATFCLWEITAAFSLLLIMTAALYNFLYRTNSSCSHEWLLLYTIIGSFSTGSFQPDIFRTEGTGAKIRNFVFNFSKRYEKCPPQDTQYLITVWMKLWRFALDQWATFSTSKPTLIVPGPLESSRDLFRGQEIQ